MIIKKLKRVNMKFAVKKNEITRENINGMVVFFYTKILKSNNEVSTVFSDALGSDLKGDVWQVHIEKLTNFWAMQTLGAWGYEGSPLAVHFDLPIKSEMFTSWLDMFFETIDSMYEEKTGQIFKDRATIIAGNFKRNLGL